MPIWAFVLILLFAAVTFASHFLFPSVRWFFRKRAERVIAKLNKRLTRPIEPFKLARRYDMIQRLIYDPEVTQAVADYAREEKIPENVAFEKARHYAREIVPSFSATAYFTVGMRLARWLTHALYRVRLGAFDRDALEKIDPDATVIFVMNHRSNMDYVLVTHLVSRAGTLSYAVGEWARVWPLSALIRLWGAYFIRRRSRGALYRKVLSRYVAMATEGGVTQAVFPEGGLTRTGALQPAKLGLLAYMAEGFQPGVSRDVAFVPVGLNYDRVLEDRILTEGGGEGRFRFSPLAFAGFLGRLSWLRLTGRMHRFGYACVSFGAPLSLTEFMRERGGADIDALGADLMQRVGAVVPVLPVSLVATVMQEAESPLSPLEVKVRTQALMHSLVAAGAHAHIPRGDDDYAVDVGLRMMRLRQLVIEEDGLLVANPKEGLLLAYYANAIAHLPQMSA